MDDRPFEPTETQQRIAAHAGGVLDVTGAPGSGRTEALTFRARGLLAQGSSPASLLGLSPSRGSATALAERLAQAGEVECTTLAGLAERLLRAHPVEAGIDPFFERVGTGDRIALLRELIDDLPLRHMEIRGDPAGLLATLVRRIDRLRADGIDPARFLELVGAREAASSGPVPPQQRDRDFAAVFAHHDRLLAERGLLDDSGLVIEAQRLLAARPDLVPGGRHLLVDDLEDASGVELSFLETVQHRAASSVRTWCSPLAIAPHRREASHGSDHHLSLSLRCGRESVDAARAVLAPVEGGLGDAEASDRPAGVRFWRCESARAQAQAVAQEIERLVSAGEAEARQVCVVVRPGPHAGRAVAAALEERTIPVRLAGPGPFFDRAEVRDVLAWMRLLADPGDAPAATRALTRPPVELRSADLARCVAIARRRKLDLPAALEAALESPQLRPEARDRIEVFLRLHRSATQAFEEMQPDLFVRRLIERVGVRQSQLFSADPATVERLIALSRLAELAAAWVRRHPRGSTRELARTLRTLSEVPLGAGEVAGLGEGTGPATGVLIATPEELKGSEFDYVFACDLEAGPPSPPGVPGPSGGAEERRSLALSLTRARAGTVLSRVARTPAGEELAPQEAYEAARAVLAGIEEERDEELFAPGEEVHAAFRTVRDEALSSAWQAGRSLGELRLDTYMDVERSVARHLELIKLAALLQRPAGQPLEEASAAIEEVLGRVATPEQREILAGSTLGAFLDDTDRAARRRVRALAGRSEPSLEAFIPRAGHGLALSAGDLELYRSCPLKYKLSRVLSIPQEPTINQRFGIVVHQVLERYHAEEAQAGPESTPDAGLQRLLTLLDASWRRAGFGTGDDELQFRDRAVAALARYHERHREEAATPVWIERSFAFEIGEHRLRGRVDRVDRLPDGGYELIDYKTGRHKTPEELADDVQLALYRVAAREAWEVDAPAGSYWYVLDDAKVSIEPSPDDAERVERTVLEVAGGIESQDFEPRPSPERCPWCEYRVICPAAEV